MQETLATASSRRTDKLNETVVGNFSHSEIAECRPEFVAFNMGSFFGIAGCIVRWMHVAVLLLAGSSP